MTARALITAVLGAALSFVALWWPLTWWALPVQVAGILLLAVGAHGLIAAVDPPELCQDTDEAVAPLLWPAQDYDQEAA